jgi:predicted nuclease of predicted toxin-antitoxin system
VAEELGFFIDEGLPPAIADILRARGLQALSVVGEARQGLADEEQLHFAAIHNLVLVTANIADYVELARQWAASGREHVGLVFILTKRFPRRDAAAIARALQALAAQETLAQMRNNARFLVRT